MMKAQYTMSLVLGLVMLIAAAVALVGAITLLTQSLSRSHLLTLISVLGWIVLGLMLLVRSRPRMRVSTAGVRQTGGWNLAWDEVRALQIFPSKLVIEPTRDALRRQSVRSAVQWSRLFAPGQRSRRAIVLPQLRLDEAAWEIIRAHGVEMDTSPGP